MNQNLKTAFIAAAVSATIAAPAGYAADRARLFGGGADLVSTDTTRTTLGVRGTEASLGTAKISHDPSAPGATDVNASALSLRVDGVGTAAQGIYMDAPDGTTGKALNFRVRGAEYLTLLPPMNGQPAKMYLNGKLVQTAP